MIILNQNALSLWVSNKFLTPEHSSQGLSQVVIALQSLEDNKEISKTDNAEDESNAQFPADDCPGFSFQKVFLGHNTVVYSSQYLKHTNRKMYHL